jgi:predicted permease
VLLLVIAGLGTRTLIALERLEPGFDITHLLTARVTLPERLPPETAAEWFRGAAQEIGRLPGVEAVGATSRLPFAGGRFNPNLGLEIEGYVPTDERGTWAVDYTVTPGYLETIKVPMVEGRSMADSDGPDAPRVAVINEAMARRYWPGRSPLGARLRIGTDAASATWRTIVGVVGNIRNDDADQPPVPYLYIPLAQGPLSSMSLALRTSGDPTALAEPLRRTLAAYDADQPVYEVRSMEQLLDEDLRGSRVLIQILELFAAVALGLAGIGIWGVVAHSVGQRTREIGLRMALGATRAQVLRTVVGQGLMPVVLGLTAGIVAALMAGRLMQRILFQVSPQDPMTLGLTALALTTVSLIAMLGPGLRAARMDPLRALREE